MSVGGDCSFEGSRQMNGEGEEGIPEYEKRRLARISENKAKLEALGLTHLSSFFTCSSGKEQSKAQSARTRKGKGNAVESEDEDEEYLPSVHDGVMDDDDDDGDEGESSSASEELEIYESSSNSWRKGMKRRSIISSKAKKRNARKCLDNSVVFDDEIALKQAIGLSLGVDSAVQSGVSVKISQSYDKNVGRVCTVGEKDRAENQECVQRKKTRKLDKPRVQLTEDEVVVYFFAFDESGKEYITQSDVKRMASAHDFSWKDTEIADMIHFFDYDGDGKLNFGDFRSIVSRCGMILEA